MKGLLFTISLLLSFSCLSQTIEKPVYYLDVNGYSIPKDVFIKKSSRNAHINESYFSITFENDTCYLRQLVKRKNYGRLNKSQRAKLFSNLNTNTKTPEEKFSIILYHPGRDTCNNGHFRSNGIKNNIYGKGYLRKLKTYFDYKIFWVHKKDESIKFNRVSYINWQQDKNQFIEKLFFEYHYLCNSFLIINNSTGNYISIFGESGGNTVVKIAKEIRGF
ncbi:MAG: hypothetical protein V7719_13930 [Psychroserpens sp.]|uniref:hypothetical protein n=1 Tax=Psychroserpens sp. TaxID=2020870 RepID=UPI003001786C